MDKAELIAKAIEEKADDELAKLDGMSGIALQIEDMGHTSIRVAAFRDAAAIARTYRIPEGKCEFTGVGEIS